MSILELMGYGSGITALLMTLIQVSAIRINPWSYLAERLGKAMNREVIEKVESLEKSVSRIELKQGETDAITARVRILRFGDEMQLNVQHSKEHFDQIMTDIRTYEKYCQEHPDFANNITPATIQYIKENYMERLRKHDFLRPDGSQEYNRKGEVQVS